MPAAPSQDRLRQIAILVSSVDAAAARQLLLHLPTETAKQVRNMAANLGAISAEEKRSILAAFQQSSASSPSPAAFASPAQSAAAPTTPMPGQATQLAPQNAFANSAVVDGKHPTHQPLRTDEVDHAVSELSSQTTLTSETPTHASDSPWDGISDVALLRFVQGERPAVIAVVASQLKPHVAATILGQLPPELSCDVIRRLSRLQEIAPEAKAAIDEHVRTELGAHRQRVESEMENSRRMQALFQAAPESLRSQWQHALNASSEASFGGTSPQESTRPTGVRVVPLPRQQPHPNAPQVAEQFPTSAAQLATSGTVNNGTDRMSDGSGSGNLNITDSASVAQPTLADLYGDAAITTADLPVGSNASQAANPSILPFPGNTKSEPTQNHPIDRAAVQTQFERILDMPPHAIASLLSNTDSETVLLALAGATPSFMRRFYGMLDRRDAKTLDSRLRQIGPLKIRDIDEAQERIVEQSRLIVQTSLPNGAKRKAA